MIKQIKCLNEQHQLVEFYFYQVWSACLKRNNLNMLTNPIKTFYIKKNLGKRLLLKSYKFLKNFILL